MIKEKLFSKRGCVFIFFLFFFSLDSLLDGGLYTGQVTEFAGDVAVGKTQVLNLMLIILIEVLKNCPDVIVLIFLSFCCLT